MVKCFVRSLCLAVAVCLAGLVALGETGEEEEFMDLKRYEIAAAEYAATPPAVNPDSDWSDPEMASAFDAWWDAYTARQGVEILHPEALNQFTENTARMILGHAGDESVIYSPLSLWFELDLLAKLTSGDSQEQVLKVLGEESVQSLAEQSSSLFDSQYWDDGMSACVPGASLWLNSGVDIAPEAIAALKSNTSIFRGDMEEEGYIQALRWWLNKMTRGLLSESVASLRFEEEIQLSLASTLYYRNQWTKPFLKEATLKDTFHSPRGDVEADFMHLTEANVVYQGDGFSAVVKTLQNSERAVFILPEEGLEPADLVASAELFRFLNDPEAWQDRQDAMVRFSMPRLDCSSELKLRESLEKLGIVDAFEPGLADFTGNLSSDKPLGLSSMLQIARLTMDEDGVEAAAITISGVLGALGFDREVDFTLNRPFLFALLGSRNVPLFIGVVNEP